MLCGALGSNFKYKRWEESDGGFRSEETPMSRCRNKINTFKKLDKNLFKSKTVYHRLFCQRLR